MGPTNQEGCSSLACYPRENIPHRTHRKINEAQVKHWIWWYRVGKSADLWIISLVFWKMWQVIPPSLSEGGASSSSISSHKHPLWIYSGLLITGDSGNLQSETLKRLVVKQRRRLSSGQNHSFSSFVFSDPLKIINGSELFPGCETNWKETTYWDVQWNDSVYNPKECSQIELWDSEERKEKKKEGKGRELVSVKPK